MIVAMGKGRSLQIRRARRSRQQRDMLPTPDLSHLKAADYERIYEPAGTYPPLPFVTKPQVRTIEISIEDTFLFLDALEKDADFLRSRRPLVCLEIG
jgi:release factor glutamine methyltransferase